MSTSNFVERGKEWLLLKLLEHDSKTAVYLPAGDESRSIEIRVVPRRTRLNSISKEYVVAAAGELDFIVGTHDLPDDPETGDVILYAGRRWIVSTCYDWHSVGTAAWKWCGGYLTARRIHTKCEGTESGE